MAQKYYETKEFKDLQRKYYAVLKVGGFKDIETLKDIRTNNVNKQIITVNFDHVRHFEKCSIYLNSNEIKDKFDLFIFEQYCEGISIREIEVLMKTTFKFGAKKKDAIHARLLRLLKDARIEPITFNF